MKIVDNLRSGKKNIFISGLTNPDFNLKSSNMNIALISFVCEPGRVAQSVGHLARKSGVLGSIPGLATYFCLLPLFPEGQLSVTGESMCTKYWLTA